METIGLEYIFDYYNHITLRVTTLRLRYFSFRELKRYVNLKYEIHVQLEFVDSTHNICLHYLQFRMIHHQSHPESLPSRILHPNQILTTHTLEIFPNFVCGPNSACTEFCKHA